MPSTESIIVALICLAAFTYLVYKLVMRFRGRITCGDCSCGSDKSKAKAGHTPVSLTVGRRDVH
ncbi:MAG: hypothetical protein GC159_10680 [Phycisphaera sp.]|nr:hypothetical protein [Phycisphaera sp.]